MSNQNVNVFVAPDGNAFMRDIAMWIVEAAALNGRNAQLIGHRLPRDDGSTNLVVAPHEFFFLRTDTDREIRAAAKCSIPVCTEQPGTPWFHMALGFCIGSRMIVDINPVGIEAIERAGFAAHRLALGAVPSMDRSGPLVTGVAPSDLAGPERDIDVLFLGGATDRRSAALARLGPVLWNRHAELRLFSFSRPIQGDEPGVVFGDDKYDLLARSKVLVNLHRSDDSDGYFEWARMVETMANRCAVVTEPSQGYEPLEPGRHFVESDLDGLADRVIDLLDDDSRRNAVANAAYDAVMTERPFSDAVGEMLERVEHVTSVPAGRRGSLARARASRRPIIRAHKPPLLGEFRPLRDHRRAVYDQLLAEMHHRREIDELRCLVENGVDDSVDRVESPSFASTEPEVSVIVTLYNYCGLVSETLESIASSTDVTYEVVVVDDHSTDNGREVVAAFIESRPDVPIMLLASNVNRGLPDARNLAISNTRADKIMVMDADNMVYPTCLRRLSDALESDPAASFAYATLEAFGTDPGLRSARGWHVPWLCEANYIDAQAMLRRSAWDHHGGYRSDDSIHGWEDWDLWLRMAHAGEYGHHLPQMLGRYRTQESSMISITNLVADDLRAGLLKRYPTLPWPERTAS